MTRIAMLWGGKRTKPALTGRAGMGQKDHFAANQGKFKSLHYLKT